LYYKYVLNNLSLAFHFCAKMWLYQQKKSSSVLQFIKHKYHNKFNQNMDKPLIDTTYQEGTVLTECPRSISVLHKVFTQNNKNNVYFWLFHILINFHASKLLLYKIWHFHSNEKVHCGLLVVMPCNFVFSNVSRWRQYVPPKHWQSHTKLHDTTTQRKAHNPQTLTNNFSIHWRYENSTNYNSTYNCFIQQFISEIIQFYS
jgi:hypothetical protein